MVVLSNREAGFLQLNQQLKASRLKLAQHIDKIDTDEIFSCNFDDSTTLVNLLIHLNAFRPCFTSGCIIKKFSVATCMFEGTYPVLFSNIHSLCTH